MASSGFICFFCVWSGCGGVGAIFGGAVRVRGGGGGVGGVGGGVSWCSHR